MVNTFSEHNCKIAEIPDRSCRRLLACEVEVTRAFRINRLFFVYAFICMDHVLNEPVKSFDKSSPGGECTPCASWSLTFFARHRRPRDAPVSWGPRYRQRFPPLHARSNFNLHQGRNRVCRRKELSTLCNRKHFYWKIYIDIFFR